MACQMLILPIQNKILPLQNKILPIQIKILPIQIKKLPIENKIWLKLGSIKSSHHITATLLTENANPVALINLNIHHAANANNV